MTDLIHNFQSFTDDVKINVEPAPVPEKARPLPPKTVKGLYEMIDGKLPKPKTNAPRPASRQPGCVSLTDAVREAVAFLVRR